MTDRDDKEKRGLEAIQALILMNETQRDYLEAALGDAINGNWDSASFHLQMASDVCNQDIEMLMAVVRGGKGMN